MCETCVRCSEDSEANVLRVSVRVWQGSMWCESFLSRVVCCAIVFCFVAEKIVWNEGFVLARMFSFGGRTKVFDEEKRRVSLKNVNV